MIRVPVDDSTNPTERFDRLLTGLLAVNKMELQKIDAALEAYSAFFGIRFGPCCDVECVSSRNYEKVFGTTSLGRLSTFTPRVLKTWIL
jgi:hypothetical protein